MMWELTMGESEPSVGRSTSSDSNISVGLRSAEGASAGAAADCTWVRLTCSPHAEPQYQFVWASGQAAQPGASMLDDSAAAACYVWMLPTIA